MVPTRSKLPGCTKGINMLSQRKGYIKDERSKLMVGKEQNSWSGDTCTCKYLLTAKMYGKVA